MSKTVLLSALTLVKYEGKKQSLGQQFHASPAEAERFIEAGQAERVTAAEQKAAEAPAKK